MKNEVEEQLTDEQLIEHLKTGGYSNVRRIEGRGLCGTVRMIFTVGLVVDITYYSYEGRYCYPSMSDALDGLKNWDGLLDPPGNWIKYKSSKITYSNPNFDKND